MLEQYLSYIKELAIKDDKAQPIAYKLWCLTACDKQAIRNTKKILKRVKDYRYSLPLLSSDTQYSMFRCGILEPKTFRYIDEMLQSLNFTDSELAIVNELEYHAKNNFRTELYNTFGYTGDVSFLAQPVMVSDRALKYYGLKRAELDHKYKA